MENWDVKIFTGSYSVEDGKPVVELFGKTKNDESISVRYKGFLPYFHVIAPKDEVAEVLGEDPEVLNLEDITLFHDGSDRTATKVTIRIPADVPRYRSKFMPEYKVMAADIPFQHRFIYDMNLGSCVRVFGKIVESENFTTDLVVEPRVINHVERTRQAAAEYEKLQAERTGIEITFILIFVVVSLLML